MMASLSLPLLVHDVGSEYEDPQAQYSIVTQSLVNATMELLQDHRCFETPQGWVLALDRAFLRTFLWRPQDGHRIALPDMEQDFPRSCKCLLISSGTPGGAGSFCAVMVLDLDEFEYWLCRVGGSRWERHGYTLTMYDAEDRPVERHMARLHGIAAVGGRVYYEFTGNELGFVDFHPADDDDDEPKRGLIEVDMVDTPAGTPMWSSYLVESCGELFLVVVFFEGRSLYKIADVAVYKMDFSGPAWRKVDGIGDRVFLLGGDSMGASNFGASCAASQHGLPGNCVYFLNHVATNENFLHVFDMDSGTQEVRRPFREFVDSLRPPFWMLPTTEEA